MEQGGGVAITFANVLHLLSGMPCNKSINETQSSMSERKQQILQSAIHIIAEQGYGALTMRALARASDLKLGALQHHYRTMDEMLQALVDYIAREYRRSLDAQFSNTEAPTLYQIVSLMLRNHSADDTLDIGRLWPQLCAMKQVYPLMADLLNSLYEGYLQILESALKELGARNPHIEALCLMSLIEGTADFIGSGKHWESDADALRNTVLEFIAAKYGKS